ncbi:MAG TPA: hypothetical protein VK666_18465 [Chryseolinea sp.]|nr:hypothetical protein [Chryseolinea sp.]
MRKFLLELMLFSLFLLLLISISILLPTTPRAANSLLFAKNQKDSLLQHVKGPRIIFIGGSNLSFGLNSQLIKDSLDLNPINTAIHVGLGFQYMIDDILPYIQERDIVIVAPEYQCFYGELMYGQEELFRTIFDVELKDIRKLKTKQIVNLLPYVLPYAFSKFKPSEYYGFKQSDVYSVNSFNQYGDVYAHWGLPRTNFSSFSTITEPFNHELIPLLKGFKEAVEAKKAVVYVTFPGYQAASFDRSIAQIDKVESKLKKEGFSLLGTPKRYKIPDTMMFNTPYHLSKEGVDYRTQLLIEDIRTRGLN